MKQRTRYVITGALAGGANGLFGSGGGLFLVPLFIRWIGLKPKSAFATSVAVVALLSPVSLLVFWWQGRLSVTGAWPYLVGGALGGLVAGALFKKVSAVWLRRIFGVLLLYGGVRAVLLL